MISDANRKRSTEVNRFTIDGGRGAKGGGGGVGVGGRGGGECCGSINMNET